MGKRGPRPKPTILLTSWRKNSRKKIREVESKLPLSRPPTWLSAEEKKIYKRKAKEVLEMGVAKQPDSDILARYCFIYIQVLKSIDLIRRVGTNYFLKDKEGNIRCSMPHQHTIDFHQFHKEMIAIEKEFGLTPAARCGLTLESIPNKPLVPSRRRA